MVVTFHALGHTKITMFKDIAIELLELMGVPAEVPGELLPEELAQAADHLRLGLASMETEKKDEFAQEEDDDDDEPVPMQSRAQPLLELLSEARVEKSMVTWTEGFSKV